LKLLTKSNLIDKFDTHSVQRDIISKLISFNKNDHKNRIE